MTSPVIQPWQIGYKILNRFEIMDIKKGGMGIVYVVSDHDWNGRIFAAKTFQDKYLWDKNAFERFITEAEIWTDLERHSNIVFANFVATIEGKPVLFLEYIEGGDLTRYIGNLQVNEALDFAIQFCTGMNYAYEKKGVIHRDIKPGNVLVQRDPKFRYRRCYKITDFGLVKALGDQYDEKFVEVSTVIGTLPFMPPEQFPSLVQEKFSFQGQVTTRSDIYSFGVMVYLLLTRKLPFTNIEGIFRVIPESPMKLNPEIPKDLDTLIVRCLEKNPEKRYHDFHELREDLFYIFHCLTREDYVIIGKKEEFSAEDWNNKGAALANLGKHSEAMRCYDKALGASTENPNAWNNKGIALRNLGKPLEAIKCYDKALEINPTHLDALNNKGSILDDLRKHQEAIECYDKALEINSKSALVWTKKGIALARMGNYLEAIMHFDKALEIDPRHSDAWYNKGRIFDELGRVREALGCYDKVLDINPKNFRAWNNKGLIFAHSGKNQEAIRCFDKALEISPDYAEQWCNKGVALARLGKIPDALDCFKKALIVNPQDVDAWSNKGHALDLLGDNHEAIKCYDKALALDSRNLNTWYNKGIALVNSGNPQDAVRCFEKCLEYIPPQFSPWIEQVKQQIRKLKNI